MIKKFTALILLLCCVWCGKVNAQGSSIAKQRSRFLTETGKQIVFDATEINQEARDYKEYHWNFGDGGSAEGSGVLHSYVRPGYYQAELKMLNGDKEQLMLIDVYVYNSLLIGVIDGSVDREKVKKIEQNVFDKGMLLWVIGGGENVQTADDMADLVIGNKDIVQKAKGLVVWGQGNFGLDLLVKVAQRSDLNWDNVNVAVVALGRFSNLKQTAISTYNYINPKGMILIGDKAMEAISELDNMENFANRLKDEALDYELIGIKDKYRTEPASGWMLFSRLINYILIKGVPLSTLALILLIPLIAVLIAVARQVVGIKAFGIYVPSLITIAFLESGLRYGTVIFLVVLAVGTVARIVLKRLKILYLPRMALILTAVALGLLLMMAVAAYFDVSGLKTLSVVPLVTMVILTEKFVSAQIRYSFGEALKLTLETFVLSAVCYLVLGWQTLRVFIISYPEWVLLTIPFLIILGRWTGLRLTEYWRFRRLIKG